VNKYLCMYRDKKIEILAETSYCAQKAAQKAFKAKRGYDVSVYLIEKEGREVTHSTASI
jgi:hypothetical protein